MLVADTSTSIALAVGDVIDTVLDEFAAVTTRSVVRELEQTADYNDRHGDGAATIIDARDRIKIVEVTGDEFVTSRIDDGEASCIAAAREAGAVFLITDDYRTPRTPTVG